MKKSLLLFTLLLSACFSNKIVQGYQMDPDKLNLLTAHISTKEDVERVMGSPSSKSVFGKETWYFVSSSKNTLGPFKPIVQEQYVLALEFTDNKVDRIDLYSLKDAHMIAMNKDYIETKGDDKAILKQLFGNIGRFNSSSKKSGL